MEFSNFLKIIRKHRYGLIALPILVMAITFFLVRTQPNIYSSQSRLSAGLTAGSQSMQIAQQLLSGSDNMADSKINQTFSNVTQTMQLKIVVDQVSYQLILHDLANPDDPFRKPSKLLKDLTPDARKHAVEVYTKTYNSRQSLYLPDRDQNGLNDVLISMKYDYESLKEKVRIFRVENSDFIDVYFESDNPVLSAFVVNTLCKEFIGYYSALNQQNKVKAADYLHDLMVAKKDSLDAKVEQLKNYKVANNVLNITEQTKNIYSRISDFETRLELTEKEIDANTGAINNIDSKFSDEEKGYMEGKLALINQEIVATQNELATLNDQYIKSNRDQSIKNRIDSMKDVLSDEINQSTDKYIVNPLMTKESLITQKLKLENDLALAKSSIKSYKTAIASLQARLESLAPNEAAIQTMEADISITSKEYLEILTRYNLAAMQLNSSVPIKQIEMAMPGTKQPSKKTMLVAISGILSFVVYLLILFILFYLDDSIKVPNDLINKTDAHVLGALPFIKGALPDFQKLWSIEPAGSINYKVTKLIGAARRDIQRLSGKNSDDASNTEFKKLMRATRFEINMALMGGRNLVVTSLSEKEGKTLFLLNIASAFLLTNKKVLLIDGNFNNPAITMIKHPQYFIEDYLVGKTSLCELANEGNMSIMGNKGGDVSLFEVNSENVIEQKILELKDIFDIILIEASALTTLNQSKEWLVVADRILCVFEANTSISNEMKEQIVYLKGRGKFIGWILNKVTQ